LSKGDNNVTLPVIAQCAPRTFSSVAPGAKWCAQRTLLFVLVVAIFAMTLNGCGWRLRGSMDMEMSLPPIYLEIQNGSAELRSELPYTLRSAGVQLEPKREAAPLILVIHNETQQRRVLAVGSAGKVSEYELQYLLKFSVRDQSGKDVIATDTINQQREYSFNENEVLAKGEEEQQLFGFMRSMAIQTLLRRMQALNQLKEKPTVTESVPGAD
jgi:LPS-assembly lipoprotein